MEAIDSFDSALRIAPDHADALYNRGVAFADVGMLTQALDSLNASVQTARAIPPRRCSGTPACLADRAARNWPSTPYEPP